MALGIRAARIVEGREIPLRLIGPDARPAQLLHQQAGRLQLAHHLRLDPETRPCRPAADCQDRFSPHRSRASTTGDRWLVTIVRIRCFTSHPCVPGCLSTVGSMNSAASQSSRSGCDGHSPCDRVTQGRGQAGAEELPPGAIHEHTGGQRLSFATSQLARSRRVARRSPVGTRRGTPGSPVHDRRQSRPSNCLEAASAFREASPSLADHHPVDGHFQPGLGRLKPRNFRASDASSGVLS